MTDETISVDTSNGLAAHADDITQVSAETNTSGTLQTLYQSFLATIGTAITLTIVLKWFAVQRMWDLANAGSEGHYLANLWEGLLGAVDDPSFWCMISSGVVGIFAEQAMHNRIRSNRSDMQSIGFKYQEWLFTGTLLVGCWFLMHYLIAAKDTNIDHIVILSRGLQTVVVPIALFASAGLITCIKTSRATHSHHGTASHHPTQYDCLGWLFSAILAGPICSLLAYSLWKIVSIASGQGHADLAEYKQFTAGVITIVIVSVPFLIHAYGIYLAQRRSLKIRIRYSMLAVYFLVFCFIGVPLRFQLISITNPKK